MDADLHQIFGWLFLAVIVFAIPLGIAAWHEWKYRRDAGRRLREMREMNRLHEWQERVVQLDREDERRLAQRRPPRAFRSSNENHE